MENKTMGSFMANSRKEKGLTQQQVADKLNVSNKTVSKWERDEGYPEITMLLSIADIYSVTVDELLKGGQLSKDNDTPLNLNKNLKQTDNYFDISTKKYSSLSVVSLILCGIAIFISPFLYSTTIGIILTALLVGVAIIIQAVALINYKWSINQADTVANETEINQSKKRIRSYIVSIFSLGLIPILIIVVHSFGFFAYNFVVVVCTCIVLILAFFLYIVITKKFEIEKRFNPRVY